MRIKTVTAFFLVLFSNNFANYSYALNANNLNKDLPNIIYYDADDDVKINRDTGYIELNNNATILLGNLYLSAKKIIISKFENIITAEGNVKLIYAKEKATASKIVVDANTKQLRMDNAQIFSDPASTDDVMARDALGLSKAELAFDKDKSTRSSEIELQLKTIRNQYSNLRNLKEVKKNSPDIDEKINALVVHYGQLLARYSRTQYQPNAYLAAIPELEKERFLKRREAVEKFNRENPNLVNQIVDFSPVNTYVNVAASQIIQQDTKTFILNNAIITPCHCSSLGEPAIYGFSSQNAQIDVGNYITLQGATFDLFSLPLFYAPWFKLSIKNKRETGFLYPSGYTSNNAGSAVTVPFFIVLGDHADSTVTYQNFSTRGSQTEVEFRTQLNEATPDLNQTTQFYSKTQYIQDQKYGNDYLKNKDKIDALVEEDSSQESAYQNFLGKSLSARWYDQQSINVPISYWGSIKANGQFVSDNTYLSDFSSSAIADPTKAVMGDTTSASRRFLAQEVDAEYYGNNVVLSLRAQGQQDLFSQTQTNTPSRTPRVEFTLLPAHYLNTPFVFSNTTTWENVIRPAFGQKDFIEPQPLPNQTATPPNPYVDGKRLYSSSTISLPLKANDYINAYAAVSGTAVQYTFPSSAPYAAVSPYQAYMQYSVNADVPLYGRHDFVNSENKLTGSIVQSIDPYVNFAYIPNVKQGYGFPNTYDLWYAQDSTPAASISPVGTSLANTSITTSAILTVGATTSWRIQKRKFAESEKPINRFLLRKEPAMANLNYFADVVKEKKLNITNEPSSIYQFSAEVEANKIFESWAKKELDNYYKDVLLDDLNKKYIWPTSNSYGFTTDLDITPVSISVYSNYNFLAEKTAEEQNNKAGFLAKPFPAAPFGPISTNLTWNLDPFFPLNGAVAVAYNQIYKRLDSASASFNTTLPYQVGLSYSRTLQYVLDTTQNNFIEKTQDLAGITYTPVPWSIFAFQWSYNVDPSASAGQVDTTEGKAYGSAYSVTLTGIQDCLDMIIARTKPAGTSESAATYAIGINLKIFGFPTGSQDIGSYFNRNMQRN
ncbi:MAG: hypothetical protein V4591_11610 [Bdellovibrionota bacterium]